MRSIAVVIITICLVFYPVLTAQSIICSNARVHTFYYLWYDVPNENIDNSSYKHWNHEVLPHWGGETVNNRFPTVGSRHHPENNELHSPFFPLSGPYSSTDRSTIIQHFEILMESNIGVLVVSWWGQASKSYATDTQGVNTDRSIAKLLEIASEILSNSTSACPVRIAFHLEPYPSRSVESVHDDIKYIIDNYSRYPAFYRDETTGKPLFYVYDSYHIEPVDWRRLLTPAEDSQNSIPIRNDPLYDSIFIGLWLDGRHGSDLLEGGFDGIYTYFASEGFSYGSTPANWGRISSFCQTHRLLSSLSVGPGYDDSSIRPWNTHNTKSRREGRYYSEQWEAAIKARPSFVSVTSFNEWGEGTQIEPARRVREEEGFPKVYQDYGDNPFLYLNITRDMASRYIISLGDELRSEL